MMAKTIIHHARKSLLRNDQQTWIKRDNGKSQRYDEYYGEEVWELLGNNLLYEISKLGDKNDMG